MDGETFGEAYLALNSSGQSDLPAPPRQCISFRFLPTSRAYRRVFPTGDPMRKYRLLLIAACLAMCAAGFSSAEAAAKRTVCAGELLVGSLDSAVGDCTFVTGTDTGAKILAACTRGFGCVVDAEIDGGFITKVLDVKLAEKQHQDGLDAEGRFRTPSNRIHCMFYTPEGKAEPTGIACDIDQSVIKKPILPRPKDCEYDWGQHFELGNDSDAGMGCVSDWVGSEDSPVLAYGNSIRRGKIVCTSESTGLTCRNANGHGFFLSKAAQKIF
jgi:hypothetical protein